MAILADWWTADDGKKFDAMTDCEVKEYGGFTAIDDVKLNGKLTLGENTADNGGLRLAYMAMLADAKRKGIDLHAKGTSGLYGRSSSSSSSTDRTGAGACGLKQERLAGADRSALAGGVSHSRVMQNMPEVWQGVRMQGGQPMMPANACHVW
jgi:putative endopeptidase